MIPNAESYIFHCTSAFTIFLFIWENMGKLFAVDADILRDLPSKLNTISWNSILAGFTTHAQHWKVLFLNSFPEKKLVGRINYGPLDLSTFSMSLMVLPKAPTIPPTMPQISSLARQPNKKLYHIRFIRNHHLFLWRTNSRNRHRFGEERAKVRLGSEGRR